MKWNGRDSCPVLTLQIGDTIAAERIIDQKERMFAYWRHRWFYQYGLASKKNWQIYIVVQSTMGIFKAKRFTRREFPYLIKSNQIKNAEHETVADATNEP